MRIAARIGIIAMTAIVFAGMFLLGYFSRSDSEQQEILTGKAVLTDSQVITNRLVAVDNQGKGVTANLYTEVRPGRGLVLVNINNVLADVSTQESARAAVKAATSIANVDPNSIDVVFNIDAGAELVSGRSAGSSMAMGVLTALLNEQAKEEIMLTGDITEDGRIGMVQAIPEKAKAAKENNATLFIIPKGGASRIIGFSRVKRCGEIRGYEYCEVVYVEKVGGLEEEIGIEIVEVETLAEAAEYYFGLHGEKDVEETI